MQISETQLKKLAENVQDLIFQRLISSTNIDRLTALEVATGAANALGNRMIVDLLERGAEIIDFIPQPYIGAGPRYNVRTNRKGGE